MTREEYLQYCAGIPGAVLDRPFAGERSDFIASTHIARHGDTGKWFAAVMEREAGKPFVNLKCDPAKAAFLRQAFSGIQPGYHMNKEHWISAYLRSDVPEAILRQLTMESFRLTGRKPRPGERPKGQGLQQKG